MAVNQRIVRLFLEIHFGSVFVCILFYYCLPSVSVIRREILCLNRKHTQIPHIDER